LRFVLEAKNPYAVVMVQVGENWKCPYCGHAQVLHRDRMDDQWHHQNVKGWKHFGIHPIVSISAIVCANSECRELTLNAILGRSNPNRDDAVEGPYKTWTLLPPSSARPQPDYIPKAIRDDYYEACAICELSPEASATVIRRCLQGMIRDFCGISKKRLADEINELRDQVHSGKAPPSVQPDTLAAIEQVREIGSIGAHMEADTNVIVDVDPEEAQILIDLVELLFEDWYIARNDRTKHLAKILSVAEQKKQKQEPAQKLDEEMPELSGPNVQVTRETKD
jgi:hypothetical protein